MVGNIVKQCRLGLFQDSDFAGDLEDSKSTSGGTLCIFGSHTFVPISWMCKNQTSVSHSSTESEIISLDTGLRLDGLPALELWDLIVSVFGNISHISDRTGQQWYARHWFGSLKRSIRKSWSFIVCVLKTMKLWSKWFWKAGVQRWDMFPELIELLLTGCSIGLIWTPKSKSNTSTPKPIRRHP